MMLRNKLRTRLLTLLMLTAMMAVSTAVAQDQGQSRQTPPARRQRQEVYDESALRRFEIVTLVALPFTAIHSFLGVRGINMIQQREVAPELTDTDFKIIGASAVSLALFIGFWDWLHTHDKEPSQQLIPNSPPQPAQQVRSSDWELDHPDALVVPLVHMRF